MLNGGQIQCEGLIEVYKYYAYYNWITALYKGVQWEKGK